MPKSVKFFLQLALISIIGFSNLTFASEAIKASGLAKALRGANGEKVDIIEVNGSKQILVSIRGVGGTYEGKTFLWELSSSGSDHKDAYIMEKHGSKTVKYSPLVLRDTIWSLTLPETRNKSIELIYSEKETKTLDSNELIRLYKP